MLGAGRTGCSRALDCYRALSACTTKAQVSATMGVCIGGERYYRQYINSQPLAPPFCLRRSRQIRTANEVSSQPRGHIRPAAISHSHVRCGNSTLAPRHSECSRPNVICACWSALPTHSSHDISVDNGKTAEPAIRLTSDSMIEILARIAGKVALFTALLKLAGRNLAAPHMASPA